MIPDLSTELLLQASLCSSPASPRMPPASSQPWEPCREAGGSSLCTPHAPCLPRPWCPHSGHDCWSHLVPFRLLFPMGRPCAPVPPALTRGSRAGQRDRAEAPGVAVQHPQQMRSHSVSSQIPSPPLQGGSSLGAFASGSGEWGQLMGLSPFRNEATYSQ